MVVLKARELRKLPCQTVQMHITLINS